VNDLKRDPLPAIEILWRIGPDARAAVPAVERLLASDDANLRMQALGLLRAIDAQAWRKHLEAAAVDPDPLVALQAAIDASEDGPDAFALIRKSAQLHWLPPVRDAVSRLKLQPRPAFSGPWVGDVGGMLHALPPTCPPMRTAPASWSGLPLLPAGHDQARRAFEATDLPYPNVALQIATGWLAGTDDGEFGGSLYFWSPGKDHQVIQHSGSAARAIFQWRDGTNAVIERWRLPELDRLNPNGNGFKAIATTHFVAPVQAVYADSRRLVVLLQRFGAVDLTDARRPRWIGCDSSR
jgi:hypothetical protein